MSRAPVHPEEIECFRMPWPDGEFLKDKCYEYTYATRKSWEFNPLLRRKDWRYFTTKAFVYAGKWLRSDRKGWGDGGDCWEVFRNNDGETIVNWDYDATLCWRECRCYDGDCDGDGDEVCTITRSIMDEMITAIEEKNYGCLYPFNENKRSPSKKKWSAREGVQRLFTRSRYTSNTLPM